MPSGSNWFKEVGKWVYMPGYIFCSFLVILIHTVFLTATLKRLIVKQSIHWAVFVQSVQLLFGNHFWAVLYLIHRINHFAIKFRGMASRETKCFWVIPWSQEKNHFSSIANLKRMELQATLWDHIINIDIINIGAAVVTCGNFLSTFCSHVLSTDSASWLHIEHHIKIKLLVFYKILTPQEDRD